MSSIFDGMTAVFDATFGAAVIVTPPGGSAWTGVGQFRENAREVLNAAGIPVMIDTPTLQVRRTAGALPAAFVKGALVTPSTRPGETWAIRGVYRDRSPAGDAYAVIELEVPRR